MVQVRAGVDQLDQKIVSLLGERFRFMEAAARIKQTREAVRDEQRKAQVLENVRRSALAAGVPVTIIQDLYELLVESSIAYEFEKFDRR
jgi:isochorismate pyruvate lyase